VLTKMCEVHNTMNSWKRLKFKP